MIFIKGYIPWNKGMKGKYSVNAGESHPKWSGGKKIVRGYVWIHCKNHPNAHVDGYVCEHRLVIEKSLGRYLRKDEVIHHINGNKQDNRLENLQLLNKGEHVRNNYNIRMLVTCPNCKHKFEYKHP